MSGPKRADDLYVAVIQEWLLGFELRVWNLNVKAEVNVKRWIFEPLDGYLSRKTEI